ncbi:hypothetical protein [Halalkalibacter krulwichiae]|uniref:Uncharacterized protein n=1 Tax=Halalkalibacter krulwichiae TaxID=199441 RepID=A0A1X9MEB1_9BACI|nr:hypothetical protein [Halalkalibacter krulwichiae]ARK28762.1 hypothetical protein BkAM31D_02245 [Halalkalibacter krulwichiae]
MNLTELYTKQASIREECIAKFEAGQMTTEELTLLMNQSWQAGREVGKAQAETESLFREAGLHGQDQRWSSSKSRGA